MSSTLRNKLIRLAHENPELREDLLPLVAGVKTARRDRFDKVMVGPEIRIKIKDHPDNYLLIEELPQKGKKRLRLAEFAIGATMPGGLDDNMLIVNLLRDARLNKNMSYDRAVTMMKKAIQAGIVYAEGRIPDYYEKSLSRLPWERDVWYLEVEPVDYKPLEVQGRDFTVRAKWTEFEACSPGSTMSYHSDGQPHYSCVNAKSKGAARKLYKVLKANPDALSAVAWSDFTNWLGKMKIAYEWHFSQWS